MIKGLIKIVGFHKVKWVVSPEVLYAVFFVAPFLLTFVTFVSDFIFVSKPTIRLVLAAIAAFYTGCLVVRGASWFLVALYGRRVAVGREISLSYSVPFVFAFLFMCIGIAFMVAEFASVGGAPVFLQDMETVRFKLQINGYTHLLAINTGLVGVLFLYIKFLRQGGLGFSLDRYLVFGVVCLVFVSLTGNRLDIFIPIVVLTALCVLHGWVKISAKSLAYAILMFFVLGVIKHYREVSYGGSAYISMVSDQIDYQASDILIMIYPLYMTFAYNFVVLDKLVSLGDIVHTGGVYTIYPFYSLLPGSQLSFGEYSNFLMGVKHYSVLTSTYLSNLYVDFGFGGAVFGSFVLGGVFSALYMAAGRGVVGALVYAVVVPRLMLSFYVFPFEQFSSIFSVVFVFIFGLLLKGKRWKKAY